MIADYLRLSPKGGENSLVKSLAAQIVLMVMCAIATSIIHSNLEHDYAGALRAISVAVTPALILQLCILRIRFRTVLAPPVLYAGLLSIFTSGWLILHGLGLEGESTDIISRIHPAFVAEAAIFYVNAMGFYCLGAIIAGPGKGSIVGHVGKLRGYAKNVLAQKNAMRVVGWASIGLGVAPFLLVNVNNLQVVLTSGYSAYYEDGARVGGAIGAFSYFFLVGIIFLGCSGSKVHANRMAVLLGCIAALRLVSGDRGEGFILVLGALILWMNEKPWEDRRRVGWRAAVLVALMMIVLTPAIGIARQSLGGEELSFTGAFLEYNPLVETLLTLGTTIFPLVHVIRLVPDAEDYLLGGSYASGLLRLFPDALTPSSLEHLSRDPIYASPANWLMSVLGMSYGPGFTPFAEAYLNFGFTGGLLSMIAFGVLMTVILRLPDAATPARKAFSIATFVLCGFSVRGSFNFVLPFMFRYVLLPIVCVRLIQGSRLAPERKAD